MIEVITLRENSSYEAIFCSDPKAEWSPVSHVEIKGWGYDRLNALEDLLASVSNAMAAFKAAVDEVEAEIAKGE